MLQVRNHDEPINVFGGVIMNYRITGADDIAAVSAATIRAITDFQMRYPLRSKEINGRLWVYRRTNWDARGQRRPVIMLPGIQGGGDMFFETALALADVVSILTLSAPDITEVDEMGHSLARFLQALDINRTHVVGSSLGGYLAQSFALLYPDMIDQLVIANGFIDPSPFIATQPPRATFAATDAADLVNRNLQSLLTAPDKDEGEIRLKAAIKALVGPIQTLENYKSRLLLMMGGTALLAPSISPERVMIIDDDHDPLLPPVMRNLVRQRFSQSEQHPIDGGGHQPAIQRPKQFADLLRRRFS
jgi:maspardin